MLNSELNTLWLNIHNVKLTLPMFTSVGFCGLKCIHVVVQPLSPPIYRSLHFWWPVYIYKRCLGIWRLLCEVRNVDGFRSPVLSVMGMLLLCWGSMGYHSSWKSSEELCQKGSPASPLGCQRTNLHPFFSFFLVWLWLFHRFGGNAIRELTLNETYLKAQSVSNWEPLGS